MSIGEFLPHQPQSETKLPHGPRRGLAPSCIRQNALRTQRRCAPAVILFDKSNHSPHPRAYVQTVGCTQQSLLDAYPAIFLACHRRHVRDDERGKVITEHQASVLDHLHPARPTTLSKLAEHMGVSRSTMSITVTRLVREGYIARHRDKHDTRCLSLLLTPVGVRVKEQNSILDAELMREMFRLMPARDLETALLGIECLAKYARILLKRRNRGRLR
jgi:DNA-binding MarR family transcriptional regulator